MLLEMFDFAACSFNLHWAVDRWRGRPVNYSPDLMCIQHTVHCINKAKYVASASWRGKNSPFTTLLRRNVLFAFFFSCQPFLKRDKKKSICLIVVSELHQGFSHHFLLQLQSLVGALLVIFGTTLQTGKLWSTFLWMNEKKKKEMKKVFTWSLTRVK